MKLLLDQNLSHQLISSPVSEYPDSVRMRDVGLSAADDSVVWSHAAQTQACRARFMSAWRYKRAEHADPSKPSSPKQ
ncbi:MAG: DUF5615 family PIN-like protein [Byssovorax sp.]